MKQIGRATEVSVILLQWSRAVWKLVRKVSYILWFYSVFYGGKATGGFVAFIGYFAILFHQNTLVKIDKIFMSRGRYYHKVESWRHWKVTQRLTLGVYGLFISVVLLSQFQAVLAIPDLFDTWDFSTPANYTVSDGLQVNGGFVSMKPQNYETDADTAALLHFDESGGAVAEDSSANNNDGTVANGVFGAGALYNAIGLDDEQDYVTVPDSPSLSLSQTNTLESWVKFTNPLTNSSNDRRQSVIDKGDYKLYFDNETGKAVYELANDSADEWNQNAGNSLNGSWDTNGKRSVTSSTVVGTNIYVGLGNQIADAEVWMWNGTVWTKIGGDDLNDSWANQTFEDVFSMTTDGTNVYAGLGTTTGDAEVWMWNGTTWTKIGGDALNSSWQVGLFEIIGHMQHYGGNLYAGLGSGANDAEVWMWNGTTWTKIGGDSLNSGWTTNYEFVSSLANDGTNLYAGLGNSANDAEVWMWNGTTWTKIGGDSLNSGWTTNIETVRTMRYAGGVLYAGTGDTAGDGDLWSWNGTIWSQIGGDGVNSSWNTGYEGVYAINSVGSDIYVGLGTSDGDGEVWRLSGGTWTKIGGDAVNGSWTTAQGDVVQTFSVIGTTLYAGIYDAGGGGYLYSWDGTTWTALGGQYINNSWGYWGQGSVEVLQVAGEYLYAGVGSATGSAQVWRHDGVNWTIVGGQGINGSWAPNTFEQISSMSSHLGNLYVGLGTTANDAEVWMWNGTVWSQIGGDSLNSGWTTNYEEVNAMASFGGQLYAGLGNSNNDAEVWRWNGTTWTKIGGDSLNSGWTTNYDRVSSLAVYRDELIAGLGAGGGEAELWRWNGTAWTKIGGDGLNSSWDATFEQVESLIPYNNNLYIGLGNSTGDGEVWEWNGTTWTKMGGDDLNGSWTDGTYERVRTLATYNGDLYAGLGSTAGDSEVWKYSGTTWTKIGGNSVNSSWGNAIEEVESFSAYKGKLYAGTGNTANADALVYTYGDNGYLESTTNSFDNEWHHIAGSYDGTTMRLYIDGVQESSATKLLTLPDSDRNLLIGNAYGGREYGKPLASFDGQIDELRISSIARTTLQSEPFSSDTQTVSPTTSVRKVGVLQWDGFDVDETLDGGTITYRLSDDDGVSWKFWNGADWVVSNSLAESSSEAVVTANLIDFPVTFDGFRWQAVIDSDGLQATSIDMISLEATSDAVAPTTNASNITALKAQGGSALSENAWTNGLSPYFSWTAGADVESDILGYCAYIGTDNSANPVTTSGLLGTSPIDTGGNCQFIVPGTTFDTATAGTFGTALTTSNDTYYLHLRAIDTAGNISPTNVSFGFRFDNTPPANPGFVSAPSGFVNSKEVTLTWPTAGGNAPNDSNSGLAGLQYRIESSNWYGDAHTGTGDNTDLLVNDGSYTTIDPTDFNNLVDGINTVYFRTWDQAGNVTTNYTTAVIKLNTSGAPTEPQNVSALPATNTTNAFSFDWDSPVTFVGDENNITYCYTFNVLPTSGNCTYTPAGVSGLGSGPYATQPGVNTIYVVARDESNNINYASYSQASFTANTPSPGIPINVDIVDVSIKATNNWRLALTWEEPSNVGAGIANYRVYRSTDNTNFSQVGSSSSTTYIDAGLTQQLYYYYVIACDSTNNCGADSTRVSDTPTGKFTSPAALVAEPRTSGVTTKKAKILWSTDRASDSRIAIGTTSGQYSPAEVANSTQVTSHEIELDNLSAGTTYYFVARWTDEDGNIGSSQEYTFTTAPAPTIKEVTVVKVTLVGSVIQFTSRDSTKVDLVYGRTESFGGIVTINTSLAESTYSVDLSGLDDGAKYFFKTISYDSEGNTYDGNIFSLTTPPRPRISNLRFQPVEGEPTSTQNVSWTTNVASNTIVTYGKIDSNGIDQQSSELVTSHEILITNLEDDSEYFLIAQSRDADGNLAVSDRQVFRTALDTRPPKISNINIETSIRGTGAEARGQVVVSWRTDEPSTSQVAYAEGSSATVFNNKTSEDAALGTEHIVIVSDLPTSRVFSIQPLAKDSSGNEGSGEIQTAIIGRASDSVLTIILTTLQEVFGF
jgi:hypothetical protein